MSITFPEATPVQGNTKLQLVLTIADEDAPSLATEINDSGSLDISCYVRDWDPQMQANTGSSPARVCSTIQLPVEGNTQFSPIELRYVYDPQAADSTDENLLKAALPRGTEFYVVVRKGLDAQSDAWAASDYVEVWKFRAGRQNRTRTGTDEFAEYEISQMIFPLQEPVYGQVAA